MSDSFTLATSKLAFSHGASNVWAFDDISLVRGEHLLILGGSGSGKTTLLHLLSGLLRPSAGEIFIEGNDIASMKKIRVDEIRGLKIGMIFQRPHFITSLSVRENIELARQLPTSIKGESNIDAILDQLNIKHLSDNKTNTLSEGEKQRVGIARALANNPILLLADEPTSALDDENCDAVIQLLIASSKKSNCSLVVVTHDARVKPYFKNQLIISPS